MTHPTTFQQGRYAVQYELSRDACGVVLLATDTKMANRTVAVRQLPDLSIAMSQLQRLAQLNHAALPSVYDLFEENGSRYLVLEHPSGQTLADIALGPRLREGTIIAWARQIGAALSYLHHQHPPLVHGDVQPANCVLEDGRRIKLVGGVPGGCTNMPPSRYAPPERFSGQKSSPAGDIYALGATLHHLLTGTDPNTQPLMSFAPPDVRRPDLSPAVSSAIARALRPRPEERFASIDDFVAALNQSPATSDQSSGSMPVIGFTPSRIDDRAPADGPTQHYVPTPSSPIPTPPSSARSGQQPIPPPVYDAYSGGQPVYGQAAPPPQRAPATPNSGGGRNTGMAIIGVLVALALMVAAGAFFFFSGKNDRNATSVAIDDLDTTTPFGDEGSPIPPDQLTATALAGLPTSRPTATLFTSPTEDTSQATADTFQTDVVATSLAVANNIEALYRSGIAYQDTGNYQQAAQAYDDVLARDPNYKDTRARRDQVQIYLDATATAAALPTATGTPPPPTPTPQGQIVADEFDGDTLNPTRWQATPNAGTITVENGELQLTAENGRCFPFVTAVTDTVAFPTGDFDFNITFRYTNVTPFGTGIMLSDATPTLCGTKDRAGTAWAGIWQDQERGLFVEYHRDQQADVPVKDITYEYSGRNIDTAEHTFTMQRRGTIDTFVMDGNLLFEEPAGAAPRALWFGNTTQIEADVPWTSFVVLSVELREQR